MRTRSWLRSVSVIKAFRLGFSWSTLASSLLQHRALQVGRISRRINRFAMVVRSMPSSARSMLGSMVVFGDGGGVWGLAPCSGVLSRVRWRITSPECPRRSGFRQCRCMGRVGHPMVRPTRRACCARLRISGRSGTSRFEWCCGQAGGVRQADCPEVGAGVTQAAQREI